MEVLALTTAEAMLAAVLADPADDTVRLVYADALQEAGDEEKAKLVRERLPCTYCGTTGKVTGPACSPCFLCGGDGWRVRCQHEGCREAGRQCFLDVYQAGDEAREELVEWFCGEHASGHGYCSACGSFWGGISSFEATGVCDHCRDQFAADEPDDDDDWDGFFDSDLEP